MKRALSISIDYRRHWDATENDGPWWPLLREYVQGALDEQTVNPEHPASITYDPRKLQVKISSKGVKLPFSVWLLGESSKMDDERTIGGYGEGFTIAALVAVRNQIPITIRNGADEVWVPTLEPDDAFPDKQVLKVEKRRQVRLTSSFDVEVTGVTPEVWTMLQQRVLMLNNAPRIETDVGDLLPDAAHKGNIYVKGVFVHRDEDLAYGYNLKRVKPDLDRRMTDSYEVRRNILAVWKHLAHAEDERFAQFYRLLADGSADVSHADYLYDDQLNERLAARFTAEHGADAIPVWSSSDYDEGKQLGLNVVRVSGQLGRLVSRVTRTIHKAKFAARNAIKHHYTLVELAGTPERRYFNHALAKVMGAVPDLIKETPKIVSFVQQGFDWIAAVDDAPAMVSLWALTSESHTIAALIAAHVENWTPTEELRGMDKVGFLWEKVMRSLLNEQI